MVYTTQYDSPIGELLLAEKDGALIGVWMKEQKYFMSSLQEETQEYSQNPILLQTKNWLDRYFAGERPAITELKLASIGGEFRQAVWQILCQIPYGQTMTYGEIGKQIAALRGQARMSAQAIGGAVGHNPISIIIPCHRVVGANGNLTGYAGGIETKMKLLTLEGVSMKEMSLPTKGTAL